MRFEVLGPLQVADDGEYLVLGSPQQQKLLAVLLASPNSPVTTDRLIDEVWGAEPPRTARHLVHVYVSRLRSLLGEVDDEPRIERVGSAYRISIRTSELDSDDLRALTANALDVSSTSPDRSSELLREATALWRGPPFGNLADESDLLRAEAASLTEVHVNAVTRRIDLDLELGRHESLLGELEALTVDHPYHEHFWAQRMLALYRSGRQSEALRVYENVRTTLVEDLGIEPGIELSQLELQILLHDPQLLWDRPTPTNLPVQLTSLIGREQEINEIVETLGTARLVNLTGLGGIGKTRLALAVAERHRPHTPDGTWWIDLAPISDPADVIGTLAETLGVMPQPGIPLIDSIGRSLARKEALIILDNCEHLVPAVRDAATTLLTEAPRLRVLATSRTPLKTPGEHIWPVPPMTLDRIGTSPSDAALLFVDRATTADHRFELSAHNAESVAAICSTVDGIPLAIEMAAARIGVLAPKQILSVLGHPLDVLRKPDVNCTTRHATMNAALDWSYDLLGTDARLVFDRLSVFPGEFDIDGVEAVACRSPVSATALDAITELTDASVVFVSGSDSDVARYRLPVIVREYGLGHLREQDRTAEARDAHARYIFDLILQATDTISSPGFADWIPRLSAVAPDIKAALDWTLPRWPRSETLRVAPGLLHFWYRTGNPVDAAKWGKAMITDIEGVPNHLVASARSCVGFAANVLGDEHEALYQIEAAVALVRDGAHQRTLINALWGRGHVAIQVGDFQTAHRCATEALAICDDIGDPWLRADPLALLGFAFLFSGQSLDDARRYSEEAQALFREFGDTASQTVMNPLSVIAMRQRDLVAAERYALDVAALAAGSGWEAAALVNLAEVFLAQGRLDEATSTLQRAVTRGLDAGLENWFRMGLRDLGQVAVARKTPRRAALLFGASRRNAPVYGLDPTIYEPMEAYCRGKLGDEQFTLVSQEGGRMGYEQLMELALDEPRDRLASV